MTKIVNGKIEAGASIISLINEGGNEEETNKLFFLFSNSICISTPEGFLPSWNDSFHPGINPSRMEGILPGSYQNLGMTAIPKIQVQYL